MGLDMYFTARRYLWSHPEDGPDVKIAKNMKTLFPELPETVQFKNVEVEFGYWRKANAIHKWFVDNVQEGADECEEAYVERENIEKLLAVVNEVLADPSKGPVLLPTQSGFFFGDTSYDEYYIEDLKNTKTIMENALKMIDSKAGLRGWDFYYRSSW